MNRPVGYQMGWGAIGWGCRAYRSAIRRLCQYNVVGCAICASAVQALIALADLQRLTRATIADLGAGELVS